MKTQKHLLKVTAVFKSTSCHHTCNKCGTTICHGCNRCPHCEGHGETCVLK